MYCPFSYRFTNWMLNNQLDTWGESRIYLPNIYPSIDNIKVNPDNKLVRIDDNVYFIQYEEATCILNRIHKHNKLYLEYFNG